MQLFNKLKEPIIFKESNTLNTQVQQLEEYLQSAPESIKQSVERDISLLKYGIQGENNILYELRNSHIPMYILHDLYFEIDGCQAQIDFLVITNKLVYVLECKNLYGNIEVNGQGDFVRTIQFGKRYQKEGIYSPITQNQRHMEILKKVRLTGKSNILSKTFFNKYFDQNYKSVVVLANPKTYLNLKYAPRDIKNQIIRYDQLIRYIKNENSKSDKECNSDKVMRELAEFFMKMHKDKEIDYAEKYRSKYSEMQMQGIIPESIEGQMKEPDVDCEMVREKLREYRLEKSREEGIKAYYIYNNQQLDEIAALMPRTVEELMMVKGIAEKKCEKYGTEIIDIINKCRQ